VNTKIAVVTGFAGFIGTTFTQLLLRKGWKVYGIDKFTHVANYTHLKYDRNQFTWVQEDIKRC
jgi:nucleoside-diphosphate-sugar epimerase